MTTPENAMLSVGSIVAGRFEVVSKLAEGGMGVVYRVRHVVTGVHQALKVLHPDLARDAQVRARFVQESQVGARILSDHLVKVTDAGFDEGGAPYVVMELLDGATLEEVITYRKRLSKADTLSIFHQLCHGIGAAHRAKVIHRDIKPANIILSRTRAANAGLLLKILDFGIAKVLVEAGGHVTASILAGTAAWAPPEQWNPKAVPDPSMDVWPLGLLAFYALTGFVYWESENESTRDRSAGCLQEVLASPLPPASERLLQFGAPPDLLPLQFDGWFSRCVNRNPQQRYPDASAALDGFIQIMGDGGSVDSIDSDILPPRLPTPPVPPLSAPADELYRSPGASPAGPRRSGTERLAPSDKFLVEGPRQGVTDANANIPPGPQHKSIDRRSTLFWLGGGLLALGAGTFGVVRLSRGNGSGGATAKSAPSAASSLGAQVVPVAPTPAPSSSTTPAWRRMNVLEDIRKRGTLRVGVEDEAPPLNYIEGDNRTGLDYDVIRTVAKVMGVPRVLHEEAKFDELPTLLKEGKVDVIMGGQVADMGRKELSWSDAYLDFGSCLIAKKGSAVADLNEVIETDSKLGIYAGDARLKEWLVKHGIKASNLIEKDETGWMKILSSGEVQAIVYDYPFAMGAAPWRRAECAPFRRVA